MATKESDYSLIEIAYKLLSKKRKPQLLDDIIKDVMSTKGYKVKEAKGITPQFIVDFQTCGDFIYCGDGRWDLKERQPTSVLDKDGSDYDYEDNEDVKKNELKEDDFIRIHKNVDTNDDDDQADEEEETDDDDLAAEFEELKEKENEDDVLDLEDDEDEDLEFDDEEDPVEDLIFEEDEDEEE